MNYISTITGYSEHDGGYSGAFSWWLSATNPGKWCICSLRSFDGGGLAVTDDFGNLVRVAA